MRRQGDPATTIRARLTIEIAVVAAVAEKAREAYCEVLAFYLLYGLPFETKNEAERGVNTEENGPGERPLSYVDPYGLVEVLCSDNGKNFTVRKDSNGNFVIVDGGAKYDNLQKDILNYASTGDERYLNRLPTSSDPLTAKAVENAIVEATRLFGKPVTPNTSDAGSSWKPASSSVAASVPTDVVVLMAMTIAGSTGDPSKRDINAALRALEQDKDFRRYFHQEYKNSQGIPNGDRNNPDMSQTEVWEAYQEWLQQKR